MSNQTSKGSRETAKAKSERLSAENKSLIAEVKTLATAKDSLQERNNTQAKIIKTLEVSRDKAIKAKKDKDTKISKLEVVGEGAELRIKGLKKDISGLNSKIKASDNRNADLIKENQKINNDYRISQREITQHKEYVKNQKSTISNLEDTLLELTGRGFLGRLRFAFLNK